MIDDLQLGMVECLYDVFERLLTLEQAVYSLLRDTGFQSEEGLGAPICPLPDKGEDTFGGLA